MRAPQLIQTILKLHLPNWNNFYTCNPKQEPSRASALAKSSQHERSEHSRMFTSTEFMNANVEVANAGNLRLVSPTMVPTLAQSVHSYSGGQHPAQLRPQPSDLVEPSRATASNTWGWQRQIIPLMHPINATDQINPFSLSQSSRPQVQISAPEPSRGGIASSSTALPLLQPISSAMSYSGSANAAIAYSQASRSALSHSQLLLEQEQLLRTSPAFIAAGLGTQTSSSLASPANVYNRPSLPPSLLPTFTNQVGENISPFDE